VGEWDRENAPTFHQRLGKGAWRNGQVPLLMVAGEYSRSPSSRPARPRLRPHADAHELRHCLVDPRRARAGALWGLAGSSPATITADTARAGEK